MEPESKLIHAFGALAELGQEVTNKNSFQETIRTSLHLLSGAIGIMRRDREVLEVSRMS